MLTDTVLKVLPSFASISAILVETDALEPAPTCEVIASKVTKPAAFDNTEKILLYRFLNVLPFLL